MRPSGVFLPLALACLVLGVLAGLARMGWALPAPVSGWAGFHGPLMIGAFLGTLISLERAVALEKAWAFLAPALCLAAVPALLLSPHTSAAPLLLSLASLLALGTSAQLGRRHWSLAAGMMTLGGAFWLGGNVLWLLGGDWLAVTLCWAAFPVLLIAGERLELALYMKDGAGLRLSFYGLVLLLFSGAALTQMGRGLGQGTLVSALAWSGFGAWLLAHDRLRRNFGLGGQARFMAVALYSGYFWLVAAGPLMALWGWGRLPLGYDAALHAVFLGFVFSMIFAHAPTIFPAVSGLKMGYHHSFYLHLLALNLSLLLRLEADLQADFGTRRLAGLLNALSLLMFLLNNAYAVFQAKKGAKP